MLKQKKFILVFFGIFVLTTIEAGKRKGKEVAESSNAFDPNKVWHTFNALDVNNETEVEYRIQNIPNTKFNTIVNFLMEHFFKYEPISRAKGTRGDDEHREDWMEDLRANMSVACYNHLDELVGVHVLFMEEKKKPSKGEEKLQKFKSEKEKLKAAQKKSKRQELFFDSIDVYKEYNVDKFLTDDGLVVAPLYRGKGIERELLNVIKPICAAHGAYVFTGTFTSDPHNELAEELGFKVKKEIKIKKEQKINCKGVAIRSIRYKH